MKTYYARAVQFVRECTACDSQELAQRVEALMHEVNREVYSAAVTKAERDTIKALERIAETLEKIERRGLKMKPKKLSKRELARRKRERANARFLREYEKLVRVEVVACDGRLLCSASLSDLRALNALQCRWHANVLTVQL